MQYSLKKVRQFHDAMGVETPEELALPEFSDKRERFDLKRITDQMYGLKHRLHELAQRHQGSPTVAAAFLRLQLMQEELAEFAEALGEGDAPQALRELVDLQYVVTGSALVFGLGPYFQPGFNEVHRANMTKLGDDGKPCRDAAGRIVKGPNYQPPRMGDIV